MAVFYAFKRGGKTLTDTQVDLPTLNGKWGNLIKIIFSK